MGQTQKQAMSHLPSQCETARISPRAAAQCPGLCAWLRLRALKSVPYFSTQTSEPPISGQAAAASRHREKRATTRMPLAHVTSLSVAPLHLDYLTAAAAGYTVIKVPIVEDHLAGCPSLRTHKGACFSL